MYYMTNYDSPLGPILLASDEKSIKGLWFYGAKYFCHTMPETICEHNTFPLLLDAKAWLDAYFKGKNPLISDLPLAPIGSPFQQNVWRILCEIPYGMVTSYGEIAYEMALYMNKTHMSAQAVGGAVGHNPISIIIPCHRVVGADRSLTGYAGGIDKKRALLALENENSPQCCLKKRNDSR